MKNTKKVVYTTTGAIAGIIIASALGAYASGTGNTISEKITSGAKNAIHFEKDEKILDTNSLPQNITNYLNANYPNIGIKKAEQEHNKIEVKLVNGQEIKFAIDGSFLKSEMDNEKDGVEDENDNEKDRDNIESQNEDGANDGEENNDKEGKEAAETPESEAADSAKLASKATITEAQAIATANASYNGTVKKVSLDDEDGKIVYSVEYTDGTDVKVDANTNVVVKTDAAGSDEDDSETNDINSLLK